MEIDDKKYKTYLIEFHKEVDIIWEKYQSHNFIQMDYEMSCSECGFKYWNGRRQVTKTYIYNTFFSLNQGLRYQGLPKCSEFLMESILK